MTGSPRAGAGARALSALHQIEDGVLALLLGAMVLLAPTQIVLRNVFDSSIAWGDPVLRALVLWVGLLGALAATRGNRHITIDVISQLLSERAQAGVRVLTSAFATGVSGVVAYHSVRFIRTEIEFESLALSGVPAWWIETVIPLSFGLMALRFGLLALLSLRDLISPSEAST